MIPFSEFRKHKILTESPKQSFKIMMKRPTPLFKNTQSLTLQTPPKNKSQDTKTELGEVMDAMIMSKERLEYEQDLDKNYITMMENVVGNGGDDVKLIRELKRQIDTLTLRQKFQFNRLRPREVAKFYDKTLTPHAQVDTPSYPSNHAVVGYVIADVMSKKHPDKKDELNRIAEENANSRVSLGVHFVSDVEAGKQFAEKLISRYNESEEEEVTKKQISYKDLPAPVYGLEAY